MRPGSKRSGPLSPRNVGLALLALVLLTSALLALRQGRIDDELSQRDDGGSAAGTAERVHTLADAPQAQFFSVITFLPEGQPGPAFMIGSGTEQFEAMAQSLAQAQPAQAATDETFDKLLVISFGREDTLDVSYSSSRNLIIVAEQAYTPATDLAPVIAAVEDQFN